MDDPDRIVTFDDISSLLFNVVTPALAVERRGASRMCVCVCVCVCVSVCLLSGCWLC